MQNRFLLLSVSFILIVFMTGCRMDFFGGPSVAMISKSQNLPGFESVGGPISRKACMNTFLFLVMWGEPTHHEGLVDRVLDESHADILLNTRMSRSQINWLIYTQGCNTITGQPARRVEGAAS